MRSFKSWPQDFRTLATVFLLAIIVGVSAGLVHLIRTTGSTPKNTAEYYRGSTTAPDDLEVPEKMPQSINKLLVTTHNHILAMSMLFLFTGTLFGFSDFSGNRQLKKILMIEPMLASLSTFGGIWLLRFVHPSFVWLVALSGVLMYGGFYLQCAWTLQKLHTASRRSTKG